MKLGVDAIVGAGVRTAICAALLVFGASQGGTQTLEVLRNFDVRPIGPLSHVIKGSDGALYGTTETGGILGGTVFKVNENGSGLRTLHSFNLDDGGGSFPVAAPLEGSDGALYGTTADGGANFAGNVFKVNKDGTGYVRLHEFGQTDGATPYGALAEGSDGALYGTTTEGGANDRGVIFKLNKDGTGFLKLRDFSGSDGTGPSGGLIEGSDGALYGTAGGGAYGYGVAFKLNKDGSGFETFHEFDETGSAGFLLEGSDGVLYGAGGGGAYGDGVVYRLNKDGSGFLILHDFNDDDGEGHSPYAGLLEGSDGALYGTTRYGGDDPHSYGVVFGLQKDGTGFLKLHEFNSIDGRYPGRGRLVEGSDGALYGTAEGGGMQFGGFGVVFKVEKDGTGFTDVSGFLDNDGTFPYAGVVEGSDGALYGTTVNGGGIYDSEGEGVVFRVNKDGTGFLKLLDLYHNIGANPYGGVVEGSDGALYGTAYGGVGGDGVVYKLEKDGSGFLQLHLFDYFDGAYPRGGILEGSDGTLYGTTSGGGDNSGVVFRLYKDGTEYLPLHYFNEADGDEPYAGLVEGSDAALYGTTRKGGAFDLGVIFKLGKDGGGFQVLHDFSGSEGENPYAPLLEGFDGRLYGTTSAGGRYGYGTVFKLSQDGTDFVAIYDFDGNDGATPYAALLEGSDGALYGTTYEGGANRYGIAFRVQKDGSGFRNLLDFNNSDGANPYGGLIKGTDGALYGTTVFGGTGGGVVFRITSMCEASIRLEGDVYVPGSALPLQVHLAHHRVRSVTVPWELRLINASGQLVTKHTTEPHTFKPGDVLDRDVEFRLPHDLASGTYTLELAISGMAGTNGATTTLRVVGVSQQ